MPAQFPKPSSRLQQVFADLRRVTSDALTPVFAWPRRQRFPNVPNEAWVQRAMASAQGVPVVPSSDSPLVSIVIPVYGKFATTYWCLDSLARTSVATPYEVIVVDDASKDDTGAQLARIASVRTVSNAQNLGFVRSCNAGAEAARGEYLCFLNNDTRVTDGWLDALFRTFQANPRAGLVGGQLLFPDGRLQEAGGTVFRDGICSHYGRNRDPRQPAFLHMRPVDYCSGACLMLRTALFRELSGFDQRYVPAYYEDTDLAFRVRERGLEVLYQPLCRVAHYEGVTHGKNPNVGLKRHQTLNRKTLLDRWQSELREHPASGNRTWAAGERRLQPGIVGVSQGGLAEGESALKQCLLQARAAGLRATLFVAGASSHAEIQHWRERGIEVWHGNTLSVSLARLSTSWSARFRHVLFDGAPLAAERHAEVRRRAPQLKQWLLHGFSPSPASPELGALVSRLDGALARSSEALGALTELIPTHALPQTAAEASSIFS